MTQTSSGPLSGVRVIELAGIGPGPYAGMVLADLGAEVVRIDRPGQGPDLAGGVTMRGRRSVVLDLKKPTAVDALLGLVEAADVLIEPFRPGVAERLGIGPDVCLERNSRLVYARMTGWGQDGPWAQMAGHDIAYIAITGALNAIGRADGPPTPPLNLLGDFGGGSMFLLVGILAALVERAQSGRGQVVDAAIVDGTASLTSMLFGMLTTGFWSEQRGVNLLDTGAPFYDVYETSDGKWMAVGALEPQFYAELVRLLELDDLPAQHDRSRWEEQRSRFAARFKERTQQEWADVFDGTDACVAPILTWSEASKHPHIAARGTLLERDGVVQPAPAPRFSRTPAEIGNRPPAPGADTRDVLTDWGVKDVDDLLSSGAAVQSG
ncbi:MAG TPA: CaiB/BaiF CoA-transferase family protein [Mycobacteriales bacterium]|nr:CaiB/BaiF CoA-transferase family protein [Mycobacteriales bacterium]